MTIPVRVGVALDPLADFAPDRWRARVDALEELGVDSIWLPDAVTLRGLAVPSSPGCARVHREVIAPIESATAR